MEVGGVSKAISSGATRDKGGCDDLREEKNLQATPPMARGPTILVPPTMIVAPAFDDGA